MNDDDSSFDKTKLLNKVKELLKLTSKSRLLFFGLPYRREAPELNNLISSVNYEISKLISQTKHAKFLFIEVSLPSIL